MKKILTALLTMAASSGEKITVFKDKSDRTKDEMHCQRCNALMAFDKFYGRESYFFGWRCVSCGDILDPVILLHRLSQDPNLTIPENEEKMRSLIKKYMSASPKDIGTQSSRIRRSQNRERRLLL